MGNTALSQGRTQDAITHYTQAIDLNPSNAIYYGNRAAAHMSLFAAVEAAADSARSVELDPSYWKGYYRLGQAKLYLGDSQEAKESFTKAVSLTNDLNMKNSILQLLVTCEADLAQAQIEDLFEQLRQEKQRSWRLKEQIDAQKRFAEHANKKQPEKEQLGKGDSELASKTLEEKEDFVSMQTNKNTNSGQPDTKQPVGQENLSCNPLDLSCFTKQDVKDIIKLQSAFRGYLVRKSANVVSSKQTPDDVECEQRIDIAEAKYDEKYKAAENKQQQQQQQQDPEVGSGCTENVATTAETSALQSSNNLEENAARADELKIFKF